MPLFSSLGDIGSKYKMQKVFTKIHKVTGGSRLGADVIMVIGGFELLTFAVKTSAIPMPMHESVDLTTNRGVKTSINGYIQTLNTINITFQERDSNIVSELINTLLLEGKNGTINIDFYSAQSLIDLQPMASLEQCTFNNAESIVINNDDLTAPLQIQLSVKGHVVPSVAGRSMSIAKADNAAALAMF